jgi:YD repeat-containing protein
MTTIGQPAVTYSFDDANRLTSITQNAKATTFTCDNANRMTKVLVPNGVEKKPFLY